MYKRKSDPVQRSIVASLSGKTGTANGDGTSRALVLFRESELRASAVGKRSGGSTKRKIECNPGQRSILTLFGTKGRNVDTEKVPPRGPAQFRDAEHQMWVDGVRTEQEDLKAVQRKRKDTERRTKIAEDRNQRKRNEFVQRLRAARSTHPPLSEKRMDELDELLMAEDDTYVGNSHRDNVQRIKEIASMKDDRASWDPAERRWSVHTVRARDALIGAGLWYPVGVETSEEQVWIREQLVALRDAATVADDGSASEPKDSETARVTALAEKPNPSSSRPDRAFEVRALETFGVTTEMASRLDVLDALGPRYGLSRCGRILRAINLGVLDVARATEIMEHAQNGNA